MIIPPIRKDQWGDGNYLTPRSKTVNGVKVHYDHQGVDYACYPLSVLKSPVRGIVSRIGYPYNQKGKKAEYRLIEIKVDEQTKVRFMYVYPTVIPKEHIIVGTQLGVVQDISKHYTGMMNHVHLEVEIEGEHVNPDQWLKEYMRAQ